MDEEPEKENYLGTTYKAVLHSWLHAFTLQVLTVFPESGTEPCSGQREVNKVATVPGLGALGVYREQN